MKRDTLIGLAILAIVGGVVFYTQRARKIPEITISPTPTPSIEGKVKGLFNIDIPEDVEKAELKDVTGGDGSGLATRKFESGKFTHMVLVDLPDPGRGEFYEGWLVRGKQGESNFDFISTGRLRLAKGGWLLEFESKTDYSEYKQVVVTLEKKADKIPEKHILEGSF